MQKLGLHIGLQQKLSPQQIQFIKLLEIPTAELDSRIEEELEVNPALEERGVLDDNPDDQEKDNVQEENGEEEYAGGEDLSLGEYMHDDDIQGYKMQGDGPSPDEEDRETPMASESTFMDSLMLQLGFLRLNPHQEQIGRQLIGSLDPDGYLRRELESVVNDLAFTQNVITDTEEVEEVLFKIQEFDPPGIGARNLQECLLLQIKRKDHHLPLVLLSESILQDHFEEFSKKHFDKIEKKLGISDEDLKAVIKLITRLNPKPGNTEEGGTQSPYILPDFILTNLNGKLELNLNARNAPELKISRSYQEMFQAYDKSSHKDKKMKEAVSFVKQKIDSARWFIDAIKQRQQTLLGTMQAIVEFQYDFFLDGDESKLRPMILKDIAETVGLDISTISRVANSKAIQTEFGIYPLKYFFSEGITTDTGEDVSSREVKNVLSELIAAEDKQKPLADEELEKLLKEKGYPIARRTVAKYREMLHIPVARMRKELR